ncbi:putative membrane protein [Chitinophaga skermanii]|uniref:Putative membrane protein n=1 Tax=Chitinophaga skermanii TaxID=331697 RepID=A0A327PZ88_9BACT|nr:DUF1269 domain-containing protein [Chitinophaga skermanii]RAI97555.1 putative membrane protein [Chitinophaga skermanii]
MEKIIVAAFEGKEKAMAAWQRLKDLEALNDIAVYRKVLVHAKDNGEAAVIVDDGDPDTGWRAVTGATFGGFIGLIGGPIGVIIGATFGLFAGAFDEVDAYDVSQDFLMQIKTQSIPGSYTIIIQVEEENEVFIDTYLTPYADRITRTDIRTIYNNYSQREAEEEAKQIALAEQELRDAIEDVKPSAKAKLDKLEAAYKKKKDEIEKNIAAYEKEEAYKSQKITQKIAQVEGADKKKWEDVKEKITIDLQSTKARIRQIFR